VFCTAIGISLSQLGDEAATMINFFVILDKVIMKIVMLVMWYSPLGIFCLIMGKILQIGDVVDMARMLAMYIVTVGEGGFIGGEKRNDHFHRL